MENTTDNQFANDIAPLPARPQFLKVLCILTWVWCGLVFIKSASGLIMPASAEKKQEQIEKMRELNPEAAEKMELALGSESEGSQMTNSVLSLLSALLSAYGAMLMWQLKKMGFYIYILAELLPYVGFLLGGAEALAALSSIGGGIGGTVIGVVMGLMVILDLAFIIMYGVNLKYMKK